MCTSTTPTRMSGRISTCNTCKAWNISQFFFKIMLLFFVIVSLYRRFVYWYNLLRKKGLRAWITYIYINIMYIICTFTPYITYLYCEKFLWLDTKWQVSYTDRKMWAHCSRRVSKTVARSLLISPKYSKGLSSTRSRL